jgi:hypothetical protein
MQVGRKPPQTELPTATTPANPGSTQLDHTLANTPPACERHFSANDEEPTGTHGGRHCSHAHQNRQPRDDDERGCAPSNQGDHRPEQIASDQTDRERRQTTNPDLPIEEPVGQ